MWELKKTYSNSIANVTLRKLHIAYEMLGFLYNATCIPPTLCLSHNSGELSYQLSEKKVTFDSTVSSLPHFLPTDLSGLVVGHYTLSVSTISCRSLTLFSNGHQGFPTPDDFPWQRVPSSLAPHCTLPTPPFSQNGLHWFPSLFIFTSVLSVNVVFSSVPEIKDFLRPNHVFHFISSFSKLLSPKPHFCFLKSYSLLLSVISFMWYTLILYGLFQNINIWTYGLSTGD